MPIIVHTSGKTKSKPKEWVALMQKHLKAHGWKVQGSPVETIKQVLITPIPATKEKNVEETPISIELNVVKTKAALKKLGVADLTKQLEAEKATKNRKSIIEAIKELINGD